MSLTWPVPGRPFIRLSADYMFDPAMIRVGSQAELTYVRALTISKRLCTAGTIYREHLPLLCRDMRGLSKISAALCSEALWLPIDDGSGFRIRTWEKYNAGDEDVSAGQGRVSRRKQDPPEIIDLGKGRTSAEPLARAYPGAPAQPCARDVRGDVGAPPPPLGEGGGAPDLGSSRSVTTAREPAHRTPFISVAHDADRPPLRDHGRPSMDSERDWRTPRPVAAKPPELGDLRAKLAESSKKYRGKERPPLFGEKRGGEEK
jgi:hypothetical protein